MKYMIEIYDTWNRRVALLDEVPMLEITRSQADGEDVILGVLPGNLSDLGPNYRLRVLLKDKLCCEAIIRRAQPHWGDNKKLILNRFVHFHELVEVEAVKKHEAHNVPVSKSYINKGAKDIALDLINRSPATLHYTVQHEEYPHAAEREWEKFLARKTAENELEVGGINAGQWVGSARIDATSAYAKDGKTIAGLEVDGEPWPDVRLQYIWSEETELNDAARSRHPETIGWSEDQYDESHYKFLADASKDALQNLLNTNGIDYIELNPHRDNNGEFDGRVNGVGEYVGLIFGNGECFNAAMLELQAAEIDLDSAPFAPELAPKDFYSYSAPNSDSFTFDNANVGAFDAQGGLLESLLALSYFTPKGVMHIDVKGVLHLRDPEATARVFYFQPERMGVSWGSQLDSVVNHIHFRGNPLDGALELFYSAPESIEEYGEREADFPFFTLSQQGDADRMLPRLLDDLAYPEVVGSLVIFAGDNSVDVGDLIEVRGAPLRRLSRELPGEWGDAYTGRLAGLVRTVRHRITGKEVQTELLLTSPLRSVASPLSFMLRGQHTARSIFDFRLDDSLVALDEGFQLG